MAVRAYLQGVKTTSVSRRYYVGITSVFFPDVRLAEFAVWLRELGNIERRHFQMTSAYESYIAIVTHPLLWVFVALTAVTFFIQWITAQKPDNWISPADHLERFGKGLGLGSASAPIILIMGATWLVILLTLLFGLYKLVLDMIWHPVPAGSEAVWNWRFTIAQVAALTTVLGAVIALPLTLNRLVLSRRQTETIEQGHITDRINKAVEGLGAERTVSRIGREVVLAHANPDAESGVTRRIVVQWGEKPPKLTIGEYIDEFRERQSLNTTEPNLEVRIGAIYALERISQDSVRDHIQIMEILCAYIRQNAGREHVPLPNEEPTNDDWNVWGRENRDHPRLDVDVALRVIERRSLERKQLEKENGYRLGLERAPLRKIKLQYRNLSGANLRRAELQGSDLRNADLLAADLSRARMQGADLKRAVLQGAQLANAQLMGARLSIAALQGANLKHAKLQFANFEQAKLQHANFQGAKLQEARLFDAKLENAILWGADLQNAELNDVNFTGTNLWGVDLRGHDLISSVFDGADFSQTKFDGGTLIDGASFKGAAMRSVNLTNLNLIHDHLDVIFGDGSVILPGGHKSDHPDWPAHWPKEKLPADDFERQWRKWQAGLKGYLPQEPPKDDG
ncbi:pentapeptide repeat-containing protein [uncultured Roseovarius sp.]|uniref:pentapeptide repeat-containing protein n=1 Tax=uncultured Roseovarius sp. TaxID=293344 RepID=UPI00260C4EBA|nr:pentapeptide repeat-containing protein [uncultured Roseovarius sp.]